MIKSRTFQLFEIIEGIMMRSLKRSSWWLAFVRGAGARRIRMRKRSISSDATGSDTGTATTSDDGSTDDGSTDDGSTDDGDAPTRMSKKS